MYEKKYLKEEEDTTNEHWRIFKMNIAKKKIGWRHKTKEDWIWRWILDQFKKPDEVTEDNDWILKSQVFFKGDYEGLTPTCYIWSKNYNNLMM
jgi:hypothetical protein